MTWTKPKTRDYTVQGLCEVIRPEQVSNHSEFQPYHDLSKAMMEKAVKDHRNPRNTLLTDLDAPEVSREEIIEFIESDEFMLWYSMMTYDDNMVSLRELGIEDARRLILCNLDRKVKRKL